MPSLFSSLQKTKLTTPAGLSACGLLVASLTLMIFTKGSPVHGLSRHWPPEHALEVSLTLSLFTKGSVVPSTLTTLDLLPREIATRSTEHRAPAPYSPTLVATKFLASLHRSTAPLDSSLLQTCAAKALAPAVAFFQLSLWVKKCPFSTGSSAPFSRGHNQLCLLHCRH